MRIALFPFIGLAALGLILSVVVHLSALFGQPIPLGHRVWALHFGIFVVWIPTVIAGNILARDVDRKNWWRYALRGCPEWYRYMTYGLFAYAVINFVIFVTRAWALPPGTRLPDEVGLIGFSGHWMVFYAAARGVMWSFATAGGEAHRWCPNGHRVDTDAKFCKECGCPMETEGGRLPKDLSSP